MPDIVKQFDGGCAKDRLVIGAAGQSFLGSASLAKIKLELKGDLRPCQMCFAKSATHHGGHRAHCSFYVLCAMEVCGKGALVAHRFGGLLKIWRHYGARLGALSPCL